MNQIQFVRNTQVISIYISIVHQRCILSEIPIIPNLDMTGQYMYNFHSLPVFQTVCCTRYLFLLLILLVKLNVNKNNIHKITVRN